jgi:hypothetical protein
MVDCLDDLIVTYVKNQSQGALDALHEAFLTERLLVPVSEDGLEVHWVSGCTATRCSSGFRRTMDLNCSPGA